MGNDPEKEGSQIDPSLGQDKKKKDSKTKKEIDAAGDIAGGLGKTIEMLFGAPSAAPQQQVAPKVVTGPPQVTSPTGYSTSGAGAATPPAPAGVQSPEPRSPGVMKTGTEFRTSEGAQGAVVGGAIENIVGTIHDVTQKKNQQNIQHAQFLWSLVQQARESGDQKTVDAILQNDKLRKTIEKYATGQLPRVPGQATETLPAKGGTPTTNLPMPKGQVGQTGQPGGVALPGASTQSQNAAAVQNMIQQGLKSGDPRITSQALGEQTMLSKEDYEKSVKSKFGIDLAPAQIQAMDKQAQNDLALAKVDVLKYVVGQQAATSRALSVAKIHAGATVAAGAGHDKARLDIAKNYRDTLLKLKKTAPDKMEEVTYKGLSELYTKMAQTSMAESGKLAKDNPQLAKQYEDEAKGYVAKAEGMKAALEAGKFLDQILASPDSGTEDTEGAGTSTGKSKEAAGDAGDDE